MAGTLSTRWFWSDWLSDPGVRACGYAARGLWKDMLCIAGMNKGREYGFLTLEGEKLEPTDIARMTGGALEEVKILLAELSKKKVYSVDRRGVIYCRRMVRAEKNRGNGKLGGNPNLKKTKENPKSVKHDPKPLIPEPEPEPKKESLFPDGNRPPASDWPRDYREQFWTNYPKRTEKKAAMAKLDAICKSAKVPWARFFGGVMRYTAQVSGTEERFVKHPTTWLNRGCWDDEYRPGPGGGGVTPSSGSRPRGGGGFAEVSRALRERRQGGRHDDGGTDGGADGRRTLPGTGGAGDGADR